ncbi:hypothetical protein LTR27_000391 [Elasticomyces elasticus]|nr:hypothetical protein LTR27_000391 [Elasticomyces elasticus]
MSDKNKLPVISTYTLFDASFILEFLEPTEDASVIMRATYKAGHPLNQLGKANPMAPPYHLHFDQSETFQVISGRLGATLGWEAKDHILTPADGGHHTPPWTPHRIWPVPGETEDTVILNWAHPPDTPHAMDTPFFEQLLRHVSDRHEMGKMPDVLQVMLMQHVSASALVWFPRATWLGPLRWWVPWKIQAGLAGLAGMLGYVSLPYGDRKTQ